MATMVSPAAEKPTKKKTATGHGGVAPLRAGEGYEFLLRRLHSLSGIVPVGAFLFEHIMVSNAVATGGPTAYAHQVRFLGGLPFVFFLELFGIWLPIAFHGGYGIYLWMKARPNLIAYPWLGNWMYSLQRWTGGIAFAYIAWHTWTMRFSGTDLHQYPGAAFGKVQTEVFQPLFLAFYFVGLVAASWHFAYGIWLFAAKWGFTVGEQARRRFLVVCLALFVLISGVGTASLYSFRSRPQQPTDPAGARQIEQADPDQDKTK